MITWMLALALGAQDPWTPKGEEEGCALYLGANQGDGVVPMKAVCHWPDASPSTVTALLADPMAHAQVFKRVSEVRVLDRKDPQRLRVWQAHQVPLIADREVLVDWVQESRGDTVRFSWATVASDDLPLVKGNVPSPRWDGFWTVQSDGQGGTLLTHENYYSPAGFPAWMVRPFLKGELVGTLSGLHAASRTP